MEFDPRNHIVRLCLQGMSAEDRGAADEAAGIFVEAWNGAENDVEKFLAAYFVARHQPGTDAAIRWLETSSYHARQANDIAAASALSTIHEELARCFESVGNMVAASTQRATAQTFREQHVDPGPFFHGTKADLPVGALLTPGNRSNYQPEIIMNHIYFTALPGGAGLAAALAQGEGREHVYLVEPAGSFENDPNVTDKKFPGNLTRSYRTDSPLRIIGEIEEWHRQSSDDLRMWREKLTNSRGQIIN